MNPNENQAYLGVTSRFGNNKKPSLEFGIINNKLEAPYNPNNSVIFYNSETKQNVLAIACIVDCPFDIANKEHQNENDILNFGKQTAESTKDSLSIIESKTNIESTNQNNPIKPFTYQDSNITAKEVANNDDATSLIIESKTNFLEYQGNTADSLMTGLSAMFASVGELAKQLDSYAKDNVRKFGVKGQIAYWIFQTEGASVSLAYNYGNNGNDLLKAGVSVGIEFVANTIAVGVATALSAPVWALVGVSSIAAVGIGLFLNTQAGKDFVNFLTDKLQSFFSLFDSNPSNYELVSNPSLESNDYKSLIELLLDSHSTASDIDSLLHSFPNYLKKDSQDSLSQDSNTESNTQSPTQESNATNSNSTPQSNSTQSTIPLCLLIKDYNTSKPLANKQIQLTNIDSKQTYTQTTDSRGYVSFSIDSKQRGDFFRIELVNDSTYMPQAFNLARQSHTSSINNANTPNNSNTTSNTHTPISYATQKLLTPNNYQNHPALLYFKPKISLYFNGTTLSLLQGEQILFSCEARSGKALTQKEKEQLQQERGYTHFVPSFSRKDLDSIHSTSIESSENADSRFNTSESITQSPNNQANTNIHHTKQTHNTKLSNPPNTLLEFKEYSIQDSQYYHCYDVDWHKEGKYLQEATYYISTESLQENDFSINFSIEGVV